MQKNINRICHRIWKNKHGAVLHSLPSDWDRLEKLAYGDEDEEVEGWGELVVAVAWALYVYDKNPVYHLEPVMHVNSFTSKAGNHISEQVENESAITKFPLRSFLGVSDGFLIAAQDETAHFKEHKKFSTPVFETVRLAVAAAVRGK